MQSAVTTVTLTDLGKVSQVVKTWTQSFGVLVSQESPINGCPGYTENGGSNAPFNKRRRGYGKKGRKTAFEMKKKKPKEVSVRRPQYQEGRDHEEGEEVREDQPREVARPRSVKLRRRERVEKTKTNLESYQTRAQKQSYARG